MKKIMFLMGSMQSGGAEKSLISLFSTMDLSRYETELFLFEKKGIFMDALPQEVKVVEAPAIVRGLSKEKSFKLFLSKEMTWKALWVRTIATIHTRIKGMKLPITGKNNCQYIWKYWDKVVPRIEKKYDVAIAYLQGFPLYYVIDKVDAKVKIGWIHTDYIKGGYFKELDRPYFEKLDYIVTVSEECKKTLLEVFPEFSDKISIIENIVSKKTILAMAGEEPAVKLDSTKKCIVGVGRLSQEKGMDLAVEVCKKLVKEGYPIKWYIIGKGPEEKKILELVGKYGLKEHFILLGEQSNPYSIVKQADIFVQPSRFEGKSIAIEEAKILEMPIVVTNYPSVRDQVEEGHTGLVAEISVDSIHKHIKILLDKQEQCSLLRENLKKVKSTNEKEVQKFYRLLDC